MKAIVKAVAKNGNTPCNFPWINGVRTDIILWNEKPTLENFETGVREVKSMINKDANKFGMALKDLEVTIQFV